MAIAGALFSSASDEWSTPSWLFKALDARFHFNLDAAATPENALCTDFFTLQNDGLVQSWAGRRVFVNPPYSRIRDWAAKCDAEAEAAPCLVCALLPARPDTRWWQEHVMKADLVKFIPGRLRFGKARSSAPFPSALAFWFGMDALFRNSAAERGMRRRPGDGEGRQ